MATAADVMFAQLQQDEQNKIFEQQRKQQKQLEKRRGRMGIGRLIGAAAGGLLGLATGGGSLLLTGALAGLGSRAGSGIGGRVAVDDIEVGKLYQEQAKRARTEGIQAQRDLVRSANVGALSDAFSAYTLAGTSFGQGAQRFVRNPVQFTKNMFGQAQAPTVAIPNTMAMPNINLNAAQTGRERLLQTAMQNRPENLGQALNPLRNLQNMTRGALPADYGQMGPNAFGIPGAKSSTTPFNQAMSRILELTEDENPFGMAGYQ
jgi:uncharacterized protein YcfJ